MSLLSRGITGGIILIGLLGGVLIVRTASFEAPKTQPVTLAPNVTLDNDAIARHLGEAVRFKTISHQDASENDMTQWAGLRAWLAETYPKFHASAKLELLEGASLLYTWPGTDQSLAPIILMAHQDVVPVPADAEKNWQAPPFSGAIQDGSIYGRGTLDDKGLNVPDDFRNFRRIERQVSSLL